MTLTLVLWPMVATSLAAPADAHRPDAGLFEEPVRLTAAGEPLGKKVRYPSPSLADIDGDGVPELVVGDLGGHVRVATRDSEAGDTAWSALKTFVTDGRELKFHNW